MKVITVSANTESEQVMVHWPSGDVTFHGIETYTELFKFSWWLFKLAWGATEARLLCCIFSGWR